MTFVNIDDDTIARLRNLLDLVDSTAARDANERAKRVFRQYECDTCHKPLSSTEQHWRSTDPPCPQCVTRCPGTLRLLSQEECT